MIHRLLDRLAERYSEREHKLEAMRAREEYFDRTGKVFDDDAELFEGRMASFLEWYVLERPLGEGGVPPVVRALEESTGKGAVAVPEAKRLARSPEELRILAQLAVTHRSLFELGSDGGRELEVEDVLGGARFTVQERRKTVGISPGDLFEARLVWDGHAVVFGRTFLFHPPDARQTILDWVERAVADGTSPTEVLFHLSRQYVRWHRLGHVGAAKVYRDA
jgi:hypothetical protein